MKRKKDSSEKKRINHMCFYRFQSKLEGLFEVGSLVKHHSFPKVQFEFGLQSFRQGKQEYLSL